MPTSFGVRMGWDGGLDPRFSFRLPEVASAMQLGYDKSPHKGSSAGALRTELGRLGNYRILRRGGTGDKLSRLRGFALTLRLPYAAIQDLGGTIPARGIGLGAVRHFVVTNRTRTRTNIRDKKIMRFMYRGRWVSKAQVGPSTIRPKNYAAAGVAEVARRFALGGIATVEWSRR